MKNFTKQITNKTLFKPTRWILLALMLLLGTGSAWAVNLQGGEILYFKPNENWKKDGARFAMFLCNGSSGDRWISMTSSVAGYYQAEVPTGDFKNIIFCRMNGGNSTNDWNNRWNQTADLTFDGTKDIFVLASNAAWDGASATWHATTKSYVLSGSFNDWGSTSFPAELDLTASNNYTFKVKYVVSYESTELMSTWYGNDGTMQRCGNSVETGGWTMTTDKGNCTIKADITGSYTFNFDKQSKKVTVTYPNLSLDFTIDGPADICEQTGNASHQYTLVDLPTVTQTYRWENNLTGANPSAATGTTYSFDTGATNEQSGTITVTATYGLCETIKQYSIKQWDKISKATISGVNTIKVGETSQLSANIAGGEWSSENTTIATISSDGLVTGVAEGTIDITYIIENKGCGDAVSDYEITIEKPCDDPTFSLQDNVDGKVTVNYTGNAQKPTITGDVTPTSVKYNGNTYDGNGPTDAGTYTVTVSANASGEFCAVTDKEIGTFVINQISQPTLTLTGVETTYCTVPNGAITLSTTGGDGDGDVSYQIVNDGTTADASIANTNKLTITTAGSLRLKAIKAADTNFKQAESDEVTVTIYADIEAGSISASATRVCQGDDVTLTLSGHTNGADITWYAGNTEVATDITKYTASDLQETTSYKVKVTRQDPTCPVKTKETTIQILVDPTSAITLSGNGAALCNGRTVDLTQLESFATGTVTWYSNEACTSPVETPESITVNGNATYYAQAKSGVCAAAKAPYTITAKGVTIINQNPATVHPYEVTTFTASGSASWEISTNPSTGAALDNNDPVFSGKTTAYITKAAGTTTTFKGEKTATSYVIKATADDCETTHTFNVVDDPDNCK